MVADATSLGEDEMTQLESDMALHSGNTRDWHCLHRGGRFDATAGLYQFRNRDYSPNLGCWMQPDPAGYVDGASLYEYVGSSPTGWMDPAGLCKSGSTTQPFVPNNKTPPDATVRRWIKVTDAIMPRRPEGQPINWEEGLEEREHNKGACRPLNNRPAWKVFPQNDKFGIEITLSTDLNIYIDAKYRESEDLPGIYGHEQRHITSIHAAVERLIDNLYEQIGNNDFAGFGNENEARQYGEKLYWWVRDQYYLDARRDSILNREAAHRNPESPPAGLPLPPIGGVPGDPATRPTPRKDP